MDLLTSTVDDGANETESLPEPSRSSPDIDTIGQLRFLWSALPIVAIVFATATLYRGRDIFLPITIALMLAIIFSPLASFIEPFVGRFFAAAIVVLLALCAIVSIAYFLTDELTSVADQVSGYSANIGNKLAALEKSSPPWLRHLKYALSDIERRMQQNSVGTPPPKVVEAVVATTMVDNVRPLLPVLEAVVNGLLIIVLLFFLLFSRKDLRDRTVRLIAWARVTVAPQAMETAAATVSHYLLLFSLTNLGFGLACGVAAWLLGLPSAPLWGLLAFLLRFIPYVGALTSALLPALVAFALFPGWAKCLEVIGLFVLFDQVAAQFIEPTLIGRGIDLSPVALLISAMYWSWLWGMPGLLLATPLTACLKVAGDYIPALGFLSLLLSANRELDDYQDFYRMLLETNQAGARELAIRYCDEHGLERTFDDILAPMVSLAGQEQFENHISVDIFQFALDTARELIRDLGERYAKPRISGRLRILGACVPGEKHDLGLLMIIELLRHAGAAAKLIDSDTSPDELRASVKSFAPQLICLSCTTSECLPAAVNLIEALRQESPRLTIIGGGRAALWDASKLVAAGCTEVCGSRDETRRVMRRFAVSWARSRRAGRNQLQHASASARG